MNRNKLTKKVLAGMMSTAMLAAMPVYAANEETQNMTVEYAVSDTYTLSIPSNITLNEKSGAKENLGVASANIQPGKVLNIKITASTALLKRNGDAAGSEKKVTSAITVGQTDISKAASENPVTIGTYEGTITQETKNETITFGAPEDADNDSIIDAGTYTGTIVFVAAIEDKENTNQGVGD